MDEQIVLAARRLLDFPESGRPGRLAGTRELVIPRTPYIAAYAVTADTVRVLRILHSAQMWPDENTINRLAHISVPSQAHSKLVPSQKKPINLLIGYARVSTEDQANDAQMNQVEGGGCDTLYEERRTGASQARPVLAKLIDKIRRGDALVVVRIDRLARSVSHLLAAIEELEDKKAHSRSLHDPMFSLQIPGAVAQLEWALISERTKAGVKAAKARGKFPASVNCAKSAC